MTNSGSNYVSEWYGVRLYPSPSGASAAINLLRERQCPFLSDALEAPTKCIKSANSAGVCTITTTRTGVKDWIVCPYRTLERQIVSEVARKIFSDERQHVPLYPVVHLADDDRRAEVLDRASREAVYVFFQDKLGGEINVRGSRTTPELSFDITIMECESDNGWLVVHRYGVFEVQTMDFHGSYRHAVRALESAIDLHAHDFEQQIQRNPEWLGRRIEGPNLANVFKRTVYQLILKFALAGKDRCAGVVLGLPEAVWESWAPHFGGLEWAESSTEDASNSWIIVFAPEQYSSTAHSRMEIRREIRVVAESLVHQAFEVVPGLIETDTLPGVFDSLVERTRKVYKNTRPGDSRQGARKGTP